MGKTIDECLFEIFTKQVWAETTKRLTIYKSRFYRAGLPLKTKLKILEEHGYIKTREALYDKK